MVYYIFCQKNKNTPSKKGDELPLYSNTNIKSEKCQDENLIELVDINKRGKIIDWKGKKMTNELLANAYDSINKDKSDRLRQCANFLTFRLYEDGTKKLHSLNSCRVRLCPICAWRRSLKVFCHSMKIVKKVNTLGDYAYIFLTLTVKNCDAESLNDTLNLMMEAFNKFIRRKSVKNVVKGWFRCLEVNHDTMEVISPYMYVRKKKYYDARGFKVGDDNPNFDMFHPHFHCLLCVRKSYFSNKGYLTHDMWQEIWRDCLDVDYSPEVHIKRCKGVDAKAVAECSKYSTKDKDYIVPDDWDLTVNTVRVLDSVFDHRRFVAYGGLFKEVKKHLMLDDEENGDLIHIDDDGGFTPEKPFAIQSYFWYPGYSNYYTKIKPDNGTSK